MHVRKQEDGISKTSLPHVKSLSEVRTILDVLGNESMRTIVPLESSVNYYVYSAYGSRRDTWVGSKQLNSNRLDTQVRIDIREL